MALLAIDLPPEPVQTVLLDVSCGVQNLVLTPLGQDYAGSEGGQGQDDEQPEDQPVAALACRLPQARQPRESARLPLPPLGRFVQPA